MNVEYNRDGQLVWPTCPECGCRLNLIPMDEFTLCQHFGLNSKKDARGCTCSLVNKQGWISTDKVLGFI
jgi:hypothetical protein